MERKRQNKVVFNDTLQSSQRNLVLLGSLSFVALTFSAAADGLDLRSSPTEPVQGIMSGIVGAFSVIVTTIGIIYQTIILRSQSVKLQINPTFWVPWFIFTLSVWLFVVVSVATYWGLVYTRD